MFKRPLALKPLDPKLFSFVEEKTSFCGESYSCPPPPIYKWISMSKFKYQARWFHNILS